MPEIKEKETEAAIRTINQLPRSLFINFLQNNA